MRNQSNGRMTITRLNKAALTQGGILQAFSLYNFIYCRQNRLSMYEPETLIKVSKAN